MEKIRVNVISPTRFKNQVGILISKGLFRSRVKFADGTERDYFNWMITIF
jgi:hypothetical protein